MIFFSILLGCNDVLFIVYFPYVFVVGAVIGILGFSKILNYLLKNHEEVTMAFLIGVMLGSLRVPGVEIINSVSLNMAGLLPCLIVAIIGFVLIIIMETKFDYID